MADLSELRQTIDRLDEQIVALLNSRAGVAQAIGRLKAAGGLGVFAPDREREVLDRIRALSTGPLSSESLTAIYRELMSASFALERPPRVGYLGPKGSFSHEAALAQFGASVEYDSLISIRAVFEELGRGHLDYGVVPVENSVSGAVLDTLDCFIQHEVNICCELYRPIHLHLMAHVAQNELEVIYSKPEAFSQCQRWLSQTGLSHLLSPAPSTSKAAEMAASEKKAGAIGSATSAKLHGLSILAANIEDNPNNATRFFVLGSSATKPTGDDRTSVKFVTGHRAGALVDVLLAFRQANINMTTITSRPSGQGKQEYNFFIDLDGHSDDAPVKAALDEARRHCRTLVVLGSYPRGRREA